MNCNSNGIELPEVVDVICEPNDRQRQNDANHPRARKQLTTFWKFSCIIKLGKYFTLSNERKKTKKKEEEEEELVEEEEQGNRLLREREKHTS